MRFRVEVVPVVLVVSASTVTMPLVAVTGCKKESTSADASAGDKPIIIKSRDDIPQHLAGAAVPYIPPPQPSASTSAATPSPAPPSKQGAAAAAAAPAAPAAVAPASPSVLAITHNHPPGQPCQPLRRDEVEKALSDLQSKK
jgi:hypothetical protein